MKSHDENLKELRKIVETQETAYRKWSGTLFHYRKQQEALCSQLETLTKEKKENDNVLIDLELMNLKNVSLLNCEELKINTTEVEKEKLVEVNKEYQKNLQQL